MMEAFADQKPRYKQDQLIDRGYMKHGTIQGSYRKYCDRGSWQGMETDGEACPVPEKDKPGTFGEGEDPFYGDLQPAPDRPDRCAGKT